MNGNIHPVIPDESAHSSAQKDDHGDSAWGEGGQ
jgi:hypothetical protein